MTRIITANLNGIRSAAKKGFFDWLAEQQADVICIQETRAQERDCTDAVFKPEKYHAYFHDAEKRGYSGVGIYTKHKPTHIKVGLGWPVADQEGRYIQVDFEQLSIASLYMPSGTSGEGRQQHKYEFMAQYMEQLKQIRQSGRQFIICGDWNIAHKNIDIKNWRTNQKNSGFLPEERAWLDTLFDQVGFIDAFRVVNQEPDQYTWWSNRSGAWDKNVGWRIDYQIITPELKDKVKSAHVYREQKFSDHAPLVMEYEGLLKNK